MKKLTLNPWAIATLACLCFVFVAADSIGPNVPSVFSRIISTNKTADAWRSALSVPSATSLTAVSNAEVTTAANLLTVSNAQVTTAANLLSVSNAQVATAANVVTVSNAQITTAANLLSVSNAHIATAANLLSVSNAQVTTDGKLVGYVTNLGGFATNAALTGGTMTSVTNLDLTASRVMLSDANKVPTSSSVTATTLAFLDATSSVQTQIDSKPTVALTNVARLDQSQTWTGTPTFPAAFFLTNSIYERVLFVTNFTFYGNASTNAAYPTNAGDFASLTPVITFTCPAMIGANGALRFRMVLEKTNSTSTGSAIFVYAGPNTNWAGVAENPATLALGYSERYFGPFLRNFGSFTNQIANSSATWLNYAQSPAHVVDTSSPFTVYVGLTTTGSAVGIGVRQIVVTELVAP